MCSSTDVLIFELPHSADGPSTARRLVERNLCRDHGRDAVAAAQLVVSELTTCAVLYGEPPITLDIECEVTQLQLSVTHQVHGSAVGEIPIDEDGGLRSALLGKLSRSWGVERSRDTRRLWSAVPTGVPPERWEPGMVTRLRPAL